MISKALRCSTKGLLTSLIVSPQHQFMGTKWKYGLSAPFLRNLEKVQDLGSPNTLLGLVMI
ncbi:hypothetical protein MtrunA17_Chr1g0152071 [Medicago truncatula]|uniref:Uncharacterized protein n=1 Tax=Medicago truncatula TaxID=3880 RepID=A0A396JG29_MEDTR|nr:hypothetical protein MtrunA17_Chr1g0152071 [Medicago truncatula]